jgi:TadE-like protein
MRRTQRGGETVEFTLIALLFFMVWFGIFEFARVLYFWNSVAESTRRAARLAAVCPFDHTAIAKVAVFGDPDGGNDSPIFQGLGTEDVEIAYLDQDGGETADYEQARFVRVRIADGSFSTPLLVPVIGPLLGPLFAPPLETTLPVESLGFVPEDPDNRQCFGAGA